MPQLKGTPALQGREDVRARNKDQHRSGQKDRRRRLETRRAKEREEMEKLREVKFMAPKEKPQTMPAPWQIQKIKDELRAEFDDKLAAAMAQREVDHDGNSSVDWKARLLGLFAVFLSAAAAGLWFLAVRHGR